MTTLTTHGKARKSANPDSEIPDPADGNRIYKVVNNFTDDSGRPWQTDENFIGDEAELKLRLRNGQIRADGEPPHIAVMGQGEIPDPNSPEEKLKRGEPLRPPRGA